MKGATAERKQSGEFPQPIVAALKRRDEPNPG